MQQVWFLFKFLETILSAICLSLHLMGVRQDVEPIPHVIIYCGTYFGFTLMSLFGGLGILLGRPAKPLMEVIINGTGALMFVLASLLTMYHAERDFHLMYLSDFEEPQHGFFRHCKQQSVASLATGLLFLLHCVFAVDLCWIRQPTMSIFEDENEAALQPLRLYFISSSVEKYLRQFEWFSRYLVHDGRKGFEKKYPQANTMALRRPKTHRVHRQPSPTRGTSRVATDNMENFQGTSSLSTTSLDTSQNYEKSEMV
ncbi:uncharacterized protein LOC133329917 [Musca vetustissima]|uniref:uncharacterized protein LOC133329917 n=1 Tax=Musca vetustissima TaxID=27455 RepID=UPI002AB70C22|nr:uncharacterized protein LOC133329917 [Musca vetustissima]